jgi:hypothetical protein
MFTVDTVVDQNVALVKQAFAHIPNTDVKNSLEALVDANAAYTKTVVNTTTELVKNVTESATSFIPKQPAAKK